MLTHLLELRRRAIYILLFFGAFFFLFFFIAGDLFHALMSPLLSALPNRSELIATQITSPIVTPLKLAADAALLLSAPFALFHLWRFISPGLHKNEQEQFRGAIFLSVLLFFAGLTFCFYLILPFMFQFFTHALPKGVHFMPDMAYALDFITRMLLLFGFCFQIPLITLILVRLKIIDVITLKKIRPYIIVGAFIIGMLLTPPDVFSQIMLALPLCLLYELGIILALYFA
ncbi:twin-arginine translocase subunit TatC [Legionella maioricensis]|uniref:Sec-independent protein translocase protein TatC n=1 Tax=Legionella maioricensis TaxID=2896528 RepID=A0A9X2CYE0_9GAMM|nr:twin-arginine translocase subunit TatC [Legionella maioricensis]MCL9683051.1 twin-arginine translocase subunit TatC [Legionella maioricensis]MCL9686399.1 twin-arginine translocase subunit TatC [Legionella maioricensis]